MQHKMEVTITPSVEGLLIVRIYIQLQGDRPCLPRCSPRCPDRRGVATEGRSQVNGALGKHSDPGDLADAPPNKKERRLMSEQEVKIEMQRPNVGTWHPIKRGERDLEVANLRIGRMLLGEVYRLDGYWFEPYPFIMQSFPNKCISSLSLYGLLELVKPYIAEAFDDHATAFQVPPALITERDKLCEALERIAVHEKDMLSPVLRSIGQIAAAALKEVKAVKPEKRTRRPKSDRHGVFHSTSCTLCVLEPEKEFPASVARTAQAISRLIKTKDGESVEYLIVWRVKPKGELVGSPESLCNRIRDIRRTD